MAAVLGSWQGTGQVASERGGVPAAQAPGRLLGLDFSAQVTITGCITASIKSMPLESTQKQAKMPPVAPADHRHLVVGA
jgi:hypothetical protein